ncbi:hypothetical protein X946_5543 [Burkholderia sp. ABCPW 111]|nr:hypothetical protein X946_5543 [Burkholderia sp. ABCPW 111]
MHDSHVVHLRNTARELALLKFKLFRQNRAARLRLVNFQHQPGCGPKPLTGFRYGPEASQFLRYPCNCRFKLWFRDRRLVRPIRIRVIGRKMVDIRGIFRDFRSLRFEHLT